MQFELCGLGNALMDVLVRLDSDEILSTLGLEKGTMHLVDEARWQEIYKGVQHLPHETHPGGSCANVISTTALLGTRVSFCGQVGDDHFGALYANAMGSLCAGHNLHLLPHGHTGKCLSLVSPDAERTMLTTLGCAIELEPEHLFTDVIANSTHLHLTGYVFTGGRMTATAELALEHARAHGVKVSFDVADPWVVRTHRDLMWKVIERYASVVFVNAEEARALCGVEPEEAIFELSERCEVAVVKLGSRGSIVRSRGVTHPIPVYPVKAIDSTGAGDAYAGGFLHGLVRGYDLVRCGHIGSRVAAETVTQAGAVVGQPGRLHDLVHSLNFPD